MRGISDWQIYQYLLRLQSNQNSLSTKERNVLDNRKDLNLNSAHIRWLPYSIGYLSLLKNLSLRNTRISSVPPTMWRLSGLKTLDLSYTRIKDLSARIGNLRLLELLDLGNTQISVLPKQIGLLSALQTLNLQCTPVAVLPNSIESLSLLKTLNISFTQISSFPAGMMHLVSLEKLIANHSPISLFPETICQIDSLRFIDFSGTNITKLPDTIDHLSNLQKLDLSNTKISYLPQSIGKLSNLKELSINNTQIGHLPDSICNLSNLQKLELSNTQLTCLPQSIGKLHSLKELSIRGNKIDCLPESLGEISGLKWLDISDTQITSLPAFLGKLSELKHLDLAGLTISEIPGSLALKGLPFVEEDYFDYTEIGINLHNVTLLNQEISIFTDAPLLLPFLYREHDLVALRECRVIFLGDGDAGKSYTIRRFREEGRKETPEDPYITLETLGVEILDYIVNQTQEPFTIHFWDFGGQQLLHSMHRCFLTEDTCYVVLVKTRETKADERARYWLRNVTAFAPNSPILVIVNCWENDDGKRAIDEPQLKVDFPQIVNVVYCSAKRAEDIDFHEKVMDSIIEMATNSDGCNKSVPRQWAEVRNTIEDESKGKNYLTKERYHTLCADHNIENEQAPELLSFFNSLGVCFSYHRDRISKQELMEYKLLSPVWLTNAVYAIIEEGMAYAEEGRIQRSAISQMLCNQAPDTIQGKEYRRTVNGLIYKDFECQYIIDVATSYDLCYSVDENTLFFPALCSTDTPEIALSAPNGYKQHVAYELRYTYLPDSVVHQLMIRCLRKRLAVDSCWLRGMVLSIWNIHKAFVRMMDDKALRIDVYSTGEHRAYELFWMIRKEIGDINKSLHLKAEEFVLDGKDEFRLDTILGAAQDNAYVYSSQGKRNARELLGNYYENSLVQTMHVEDGSIIIPIPTREYHKYPKSNRALRNALYEAYNRICPYCNNPILNIREMEVDHILAIKHQKRPELETYLRYLITCGFDIKKPDYIENYFPAHSYCNRDKSNRINEFSLPYWHDIAFQHVPRVLQLIKAFHEDIDQLDDEEDS